MFNIRVGYYGQLQCKTTTGTVCMVIPLWICECMYCLSMLCMFVVVFYEKDGTHMEYCMSSILLIFPLQCMSHMRSFIESLIYYSYLLGDIPPLYFDLH